MTLYVAVGVMLLSLVIGVAVGRRRGLLVGIASGFVVLVTGALAYFALLVLILP